MNSIINLGETKHHHSSKKPKKDIITFIEDFCQQYLVNQAPKLPTKFKDLVYKYFPYLNILAIVLIGLRLAGPFFVLSFATIIYPAIGLAFPFLVILYLGSILNFILLLLAAKGLFARFKGSWRLIFYVILINIILGLVTFNLFNIFRVIIIGLISLYIWFQVRVGYKK